MQSVLDSAAVSKDLSHVRRELCESLRRHRAAADLTQVAAANALEWSTSKFVRVENGTTGVKVSDLLAMLRLYGVTDETEVQHLREAARRTWLRPEATLRRMPFDVLVRRIRTISGQPDARKLAVKLGEPASRIADAIVAASMLNDQSSLSPKSPGVTN